MTSWIVVEDEPDLYDMVLAMCATLGVDGIAFTNGEEAVSWIEEIDGDHEFSDLPELALVDVRLPGDIDGAEVSARLRWSSKLGQTAIVLMTAYRLQAREERALMKAAQADMLIYKPLPALPEFERMLKNLLRTREA
jgi:CheY-like chemotaxis protein